MAMQIQSARTRNPGLLHRNAVTTADKLAVPGALVLTDVNEAGSTLAHSAMNVAVGAYNRWGATNNTNSAALTPTLNHAINVAFAQVAGADGYDIFLSTDAQPLWAGRITEAQRAAGGWIISSVGTVTAGGSAPAGSVDIGIVGTGAANNANPFATNDAYLLSNVTPIGCDEFELAHLLVKLAVTDLRSLPALALSIFLQNKVTGDMHLSSTQTVNVLTAVQQPLLWDYRVVVDGASGIAVLVESISGQGAAATVYVEFE